MVLEAALRGRIKAYMPTGTDLTKKQGTGDTQPNVFSLPWNRFQNPETKESIFLNRHGRGNDWSLQGKAQTEESSRPMLRNNLVDASFKKQCELGKGTGFDIDACRYRNYANIEASKQKQNGYSRHEWMRPNLESDERKTNALERARRLRLKKDRTGEEPIMMKKEKALDKAKRLKEKKEGCSNSLQHAELIMNKSKNAFDEKKGRPLPPIPTPVEKQWRPLPPIPTTVEIKGRPLPPIPTTNDNAMFENGLLTKYSNFQIRDMFVKYLDSIRLEIRHLNRLYEAVREKKKYANVTLDKDKQKLQHHAVMLLQDVLRENEHIQQLDPNDSMDQNTSSILRERQLRKLQDQRYRMEIIRRIRIKEAKLKLYKKKKNYMYDMSLEELSASIDLLREEREMIKRHHRDFIKHCIDLDEEWKKTLEEDEIKIEDYDFELDPETIKRREVLLKRTAKDVQREKLEEARKKDEEYDEKVRETAAKTSQDFYTHMAIRRETAERKSTHSNPMHTSKSDEKEPMNEWLRKQVKKQHKKWEKLEKQYGKKGKGDCKRKTPACISQLIDFPMRAKKWTSEKHRNVKTKVLTFKISGAAKCKRFKKLVAGMKGRFLNARPVIIMGVKYGKMKFQIRTFSTMVKRKISKPKRRIKSTIKRVKTVVKDKVCFAGRTIKHRVCRVAGAAMSRLNKYHGVYTRLMHPGPVKTETASIFKTVVNRGIGGKHVIARFFNAVILAISFRNAKLLDFDERLPKNQAKLDTRDWLDVPLLIGFGKDKGYIREQRNIHDKDIDLPLFEILQKQTTNITTPPSTPKRGPQLYMPYEYQLSRLPSCSEEAFLRSRFERLHAKKIYKKLTGDAISSSSESSLSSISVSSADFSDDDLRYESKQKPTKASLDDDNIESSPSPHESGNHSDSLSSSRNDDDEKPPDFIKYPKRRTHRKKRTHMKSGIRFTATAGRYKKLRALKNHSRRRSSHSNVMKNRLSNKSRQRLKRKSKSRKRKRPLSLRKKFSFLVKSSHKLNPLQLYQRIKNNLFSRRQLRSPKRSQSRKLSSKNKIQNAKRQQLQMEVDKYRNSFIRNPLPMKLETKPFSYKSDITKLDFLLKKMGLKNKTGNEILANPVVLTSDTKKYIRFVLRRKKLEKCRNSTDSSKQHQHENQINSDTSIAKTRTRISFAISKSNDPLSSPSHEKGFVKRKQKIKSSPRRPHGKHFKWKGYEMTLRLPNIFNIGKTKKNTEDKARTKYRSIRKRTMRFYERQTSRKGSTKSPCLQKSRLIKQNRSHYSSSDADSEGSMQQEKYSFQRHITRKKRHTKRQTKILRDSSLGACRKGIMQQEKDALQKYKSRKKKDFNKQKHIVHDSSSGAGRKGTIQQEIDALQKHKSRKKKDTNKQKNVFRDSSSDAGRKGVTQQGKDALQKHKSRKKKDTNKQKNVFRDSSSGAGRKGVTQQEKDALQKHKSRKRKDMKKQKKVLRDSRSDADREISIQQEKDALRKHKSRKKKDTNKQMRKITFKSTKHTEKRKRTSAFMKIIQSLKPNQRTKKQIKNTHTNDGNSHKSSNIISKKGFFKKKLFQAIRDKLRPKLNKDTLGNSRKVTSEHQKSISSRLSRNLTSKDTRIKTNRPSVKGRSRMRRNKDGKTKHRVARFRSSKVDRRVRKGRRHKMKAVSDPLKRKLKTHKNKLSRKSIHSASDDTMLRKETKHKADKVVSENSLRKKSKHPKMAGLLRKIGNPIFSKSKGAEKSKNEIAKSAETQSRHDKSKGKRKFVKSNKERKGHRSKDTSIKSKSRTEHEKDVKTKRFFTRLLMSKHRKRSEKDKRQNAKETLTRPELSLEKGNDRTQQGKKFSKRIKAMKKKHTNKQKSEVQSNSTKDTRKRKLPTSIIKLIGVLKPNKGKKKEHQTNRDSRKSSKNVSVKARPAEKSKRTSNGIFEMIFRRKGRNPFRKEKQKGRVPSEQRTPISSFTRRTLRNQRKLRRKVNRPRTKMTHVKADSHVRYNKDCKTKRRVVRFRSSKVDRRVRNGRRHKMKAVSGKKHSSRGNLKTHKYKRFRKCLRSATDGTMLRNVKEHKPDKTFPEAQRPADHDKPKNIFKRLLSFKHSKRPEKGERYNTKESNGSGDAGLTDSKIPSKTHYGREKQKGRKAKGLFGRLRFSKRNKDSRQNYFTTTGSKSSEINNTELGQSELKGSGKDNQTETETSVEPRAHSKERGVVAFFKKLRSRKPNQNSTASSGEEINIKTAKRHQQNENVSRPITDRKTFRKKVGTLFGRLKKNVFNVDNIMQGDINVGQHDNNAVSDDDNAVTDDNNVL